MNHIKKFNENNHEFDLNLAISKIKNEFPETKVKDMFNDEWPNWVDEEHSEDLNWYLKGSNGEAEEIVYDQIIDWFKKEFKIKISEEDENRLTNLLKKTYNL
jgi:hypothetical protein